MIDKEYNLIVLSLIIIILLIFCKLVKNNVKKILVLKEENILEGFMDHNNEIANKILNNIYCINLDRSNDRLQEIKENARKENININRYKAIDGKELSELEIKNLCTDKYYKKVINNKMYGNIGCYLSHLNLWKKIKNDNIEFALIIEDDVEFCKDFKNELINSLKDIPNEWDIIFLGLTRPCGKGINNKVFSVIEKKCEKDNGGLFAYIVNGKNINKMIDFCDVKINKMIDHKIRDNYLNMDIFFVHPFIINHNYGFESDRNGTKYSHNYIKKANTLIE